MTGIKKMLIDARKILNREYTFFSVCFSDPQVSQYCAGMESYKYFFDDRTGK